MHIYIYTKTSLLNLLLIIAAIYVKETQVFTVDKFSKLLCSFKNKENSICLHYSKL